MGHATEKACDALWWKVAPLGASMSERRLEMAKKALPEDLSSMSAFSFFVRSLVFFGFGISTSEHTLYFEEIEIP